ncbi:D-alanyl-D-alanine carboxypeptidase family protein [Clostridium isatidis]|uniref:D-alanyl-D-alanine carboxypeptidase n=1 Tax=Clostridium isatidis TaxID=182773 RepID=A0A343JAE9_9CLOT|nr:D-alanyl-D-alanine carboxypeptidase [Clostridium isatidis]ASW42507.1 D-alanyl-D-alanine carboxypeptidase [Clostridium isatidis]
MKRKHILKNISLAVALSLILPFTSNFNKVKAEEISINEPEIIGEAAITMDIETGEVIYSKNADAIMAPASTTKLMTSLIFAENRNKTDIISYTDTAKKITETSLNNFIDAKTGDRISADDVMKAVMIYSANDTAYLMAENVAGTVDEFVKMMNDKAKTLGLEKTKFFNPSGLEIDPLNPSSTNINQTTAFDLAVIAMEAFKNDWIRETIAPKSGDISISLGNQSMLIEFRNKVIGKNGNIGGKTGTEEQAGHCFVGFYERDGRQLVTVVLKSEYGVDGLNVFKDTEKIADYSYSAEKQVYKNTGEEIGTIDLTYKTFRFFGPEKTVTAPLILNTNVNYYKNSYNDEHATISYNDEEKDAWKLAGKENIKLTYSSGLYSEEVSASIRLSAFDLIKANLPIYLLALLVIVIIIALIIFITKIISMKNRRRRRRY